MINGLFGTALACACGVMDLILIVVCRQPVVEQFNEAVLLAFCAAVD